MKTPKMPTESEDSIREIRRKREEDMRQRELLEFRTPQHPSLGTNYWGGASPLLAREIPNDALEQRYTRLINVRTHDEIFPAGDDNSIYFPRAQTPKQDCPPKRRCRRFLAKLIWRPRRERTVTLGGSGTKRKRWFSKWDPANRWPQGWC